MNHTVRKGECISSIAKKYGFFPETVWNDPGNAALREKRKNPDILQVGDIVLIPNGRRKEVSGSTEVTHRFRRKGVPAEFRLRLLRDYEPRANEPYRLEIDGKLHSGETDAQGWIKLRIPPDAKEGRLLLDNDQEEYQLGLGHLDPVEEMTGLQMRLAHLGYYDGEASGTLDDESAEALRDFQRKSGLEESGEPDDPTKSALIDAYGS